MAKLQFQPIEISRIIYQLQFFKQFLLPRFLERLSHDTGTTASKNSQFSFYSDIAGRLQACLTDKSSNGISTQLDELFAKLETVHDNSIVPAWSPRRFSLPSSEEIDSIVIFQQDQGVPKYVWHFPSLTTDRSEAGMIRLANNLVPSRESDELEPEPTRTGEEAAEAIQQLAKSEIRESLSRMPHRDYFQLLPTLFYVRSDAPLNWLEVKETTDADSCDNSAYCDEMSCVHGEVMQITGANDVRKILAINNRFQYDGKWVCHYPAMILEMLYFKVLVVQACKE